MTTHTRRAPTLALLLLAVVAVVGMALGLRTLTGRTPRTLPREAVAAGSDAVAPPNADGVASVPPGRALRGRVTDCGTGLPIPRAQVGLTIPGGDTTATTADAEGRYFLPGIPEPPPGGGDDGPPPPGPWIRVTADGYVAASVDVPAGRVQDVALDLAQPLTGRAVDGGGRPIAGAGVFLEVPWRAMNNAAGRPPDWLPTPTATTDAEGRFRIAARTRYGGVRVEAVGFAPLDLRIDRVTSPPGPIVVGELVLGPGLTLEGLVLDGDGRPMPGVGVHIDRVRCVSDDVGHYRVPDLAPGRYRVHAVAKGRDQIHRAVTLSPDHDPTALDLVFPAGREVTIEVRDTSGLPVVGAGLTVVRRRIWEGTDERGLAVVVLPQEPWDVRVEAGQKHADGRRVFVPRKVEIPVAATRVVVTLDHTLPPEELLPITGTVVDDEGRPVDGVLLIVTWEGLEDPSRRTERARSREDGGFAVRVPKGAVCDIRAESRIRKDDRPSKMPPRGAWKGEATGVSAGRTDIVVVARPEPRDRSVTVLALSPDGAPVVGISVCVSGELQERVVVRTGTDGRAAFSRLVHRSSSARADPPESRRAEWLLVQSPSFLPAGQEVTTRLRRAARISGTVVLADGSPAREAYVTFTSGTAGSSRGEQVDASGRFELLVDAALPLPWRLGALLNRDWPPTEVSVDLAAPPSADVTLRFPGTTAR